MDLTPNMMNKYHTIIQDLANGQEKEWCQIHPLLKVGEVFEN